jgi:hypothetical protein
VGSQLLTRLIIYTKVCLINPTPAIQALDATQAAPARPLPPGDTIVGVFGAPRIDPYRSFFKCASHEETLGAYLWGQAIAGAFQPLLGLYEVVLRNAVHSAASSFSSKTSSTSHPWYDYHRDDALPVNGLSRVKVEEVLYSGRTGQRIYRNPQPPPDQVVATLSFGFWPMFLEGLTKRERPRILTDVFAHHPHTSLKHWSIQANVTNAISRLKKIQELRNRVAHYEPIWKPHRLKNTETSWWHSVASIRDVHDEILQVLAWCSPDAVDLYKGSFGWRVFNRTCTTSAVMAFMTNPFTAGALEPFAVAVAPAAMLGALALSPGAATAGSP